MKEDHLNGPDHEIKMARSELYSIVKNAKALYKLLKTVSEEEGIEAWQQSKITKAADYLNSVYRSLGHDIITSDMSEEKVRLDRACWKNKKIGNPKTKMKGGVRVNNCVPKESKDDPYLNKLQESLNKKLK